MNFTLKSGTNSLHGSAYDFFENTVLDANDFFSNRAGQARLSALTHRWGTSVSGPLYLGKLYDGRNRTFWMYSYEGMYNIGRESPSTSAVPTPAEKLGDFSALLKIGSQYQIYDPATTAPAAGGRFSRTVLGFDTTTASPIQATAKANYALNPITQVPVNQFQVLGGLTFAGVGGNPRGLWQMDKNNFMPRVGFAYSLNSKTVVRGGYGLFYDMLGVQRRAVTQTGFSSTTSFVGSVDNGQTFTAGSLANPFPNGINWPLGASGGLGTYMGNSISFFNTGLQTPYGQRWQIGIQRQLPGKTVVEVAYVGNRGENLLVTQSLDNVPAQYLSTSAVQRDQATINLLTAAVANPFYPLLPYHV